MTILTEKIKRLNKDINNAKTESAFNDIIKRANNLLSEINNNPYINKGLGSNLKRHIIKIKNKISKKRKA